MEMDETEKKNNLKKNSKQRKTKKKQKTRIIIEFFSPLFFY